MKIKFTENVTVLATKYEPELYFKKGSVHDLRDDKAWRWIKRDKAFHYVEEPKLKLGRPMMAETRKYKASETVDVMSVSGPAEKAAAEKAAAEFPKPKRGRPKKGVEAASPPKKDPGKVLGVTQRNIGPALPVTGGGIWDDV